MRFLPSLGTILVVGLILFFVQRVLLRSEARVSGNQFRNQLIMLLLSGAGLLVIILVVPLGDTERGQVLSLIGILLSAAIALSSTTVLGNMMAGMMMRGVRNFRIGDFIRVQDHFGRVSDRGLFHTEIQTEDRDLTTLPNLFLVTHPVTTIRTSGTIVSAVVSLGYDIPRSRIEKLLLEAAGTAGLSDSFVHVTELGDFSVTYRVAGLLTEVKRLISTRSHLRECVMDSLHEGGIEIVSPNYMNTRSLAAGVTARPHRDRSEKAVPQEESSPEDLVFDKAESAESLEQLRLAFVEAGKEIEKRQDGLDKLEGPERENEEKELSRLQRRKERLERVISKRELNAAGGK